MAIATCTAPVLGHKPGTQEQLRCPVHGARAQKVKTAPRAPVAPPSIHRAANHDFNPENYEFVTVYTNVRGQATASRQVKEVTEAGEWAPDLPNVTNCSHCGARITYGALLRHTSGEYITVGETCLGGRFAGSQEQFRAMREKAKLHHVKMTALAVRLDADERDAFIRDNGLEPLREQIERRAEARSAMWATTPLLAAVTYPEMFEGHGRIDSLASSLNKQLTEQSDVLTSRQIDYFVSLYRDWLAEDRRERRQEEMRLERIASGFVAPRGKGIEIEGVVLTVRTEQNPYAYNASVTKMTVTMPGGVRARMTVPASIAESLAEGDRVRLTADFEAPRDGDETFAFGKRPRNASIVVG